MNIVLCGAWERQHCGKAVGIQTSCAMPITYNIVVFIYFSNYSVFSQYKVSKLVLAFAHKPPQLWAHAPFSTSGVTQQRQNPIVIFHICCYRSSSQQREPPPPGWMLVCFFLNCKSYKKIKCIEGRN